MRLIICIALCLSIASAPAIGSQPTGGTVTIMVPFGQAIELPDSIPQDIQDQIQVVLALEQEGFITWTQGILTIAIVVVAGIILYCLWRCSEMIPPANPQPPPDDPALVNMPHALVYNLLDTDAYQLQCSENMENWTTICTLTEVDELVNIPVPKSDRMFFRLMPNP